jgi:hypothetical protein
MLNRLGALAGIALLSICVGTAVAASSPDLVEKPEWKGLFDAQDTVGTVVIKDLRGEGLSPMFITQVVLMLDLRRPQHSRFPIPSLHLMPAPFQTSFKSLSGTGR